MKTQKIRWSGLFAGLCMLIGAACADSANSSSTTVDTKGMTLKEFYKDSVYLCIEGNLLEPEIIWGSVNIYMQALRRIHRHAYVKDNQLYYEFRTAEEARVSQNLFDYIYEFKEEMNTDAKEKGLKFIFDEESGHYILDYSKLRKNSPKQDISY